MVGAAAATVRTKSAPRSAPATLTPAPMIRWRPPPAMMASAACCRASPAKRRAGAGARPIRSPPTTLQRSWQRPASPGAPGAAWNRKRPQPTGAPPIGRLSPCCSRVACAGRKRRRCAGRTCRTRPTGAASWSTSAGRKPIRTAPRRTCATSRTAAPLRFASSATGSPCSGQGCARTAPPRCSAASTASPSHGASPRRPAPPASRGESPATPGASALPSN